jgi:SAM-dependent methyltransferase
MSSETTEAISTILCCPSCHGEMEGHEEGFRCTQCGTGFPRVRGLVRFVDAQFYSSSFGYQWQQFPRAQWGRQSEITFDRKTGFDHSGLKGKLVLDVGCGTGRFVDVANRLGARVVGIDLSAAAEVAERNLADRAEVTIYQADVFNLPFKPESFDYIYSIGVLHHTPDCEKAFKTLVPLLKPGGQIAIWLYSAYSKWYRMSDYYRPITSRMPSTWLHGLCQIARPMYYVYHGLRRIPIIGRPAAGMLRFMFPMPLDQREGSARVLDTFDWYSPKYQSKHTYEEVFRWFESCGLQDLHVLHEPVAVRGARP